MWVGWEPKGLSFAAQLHEMGQLGPINPPNDRTLKVSPLELKASCRENTHGLLFDRQPNIKRQFHPTLQRNLQVWQKKGGRNFGQSVTYIPISILAPRNYQQRNSFESCVLQDFRKSEYLKTPPCVPTPCVPDQLLTS